MGRRQEVIHERVVMMIDLKRRTKLNVQAPTTLYATTAPHTPCPLPYPRNRPALVLPASLVLVHANQRRPPHPPASSFAAVHPYFSQFIGQAQARTLTHPSSL